MRRALLLLTVVAACTPATTRVAPAIRVAAAEAPAARGNPPVGTAELPVTATIAADLSATPALSTLARAMAAAGRMPTLAAPGDVTLFAPTDEAFGRLAPGTVEALLRPENATALGKFVTLHLVAGRLTSADLIRRIAAGGGSATLTSMNGEALTLTSTGSVVTLTDSGGNKSYVEVADVRASNGVIHVVNGVLVPRLN